MKILSIETSCDDTGIAILDISGKGDFKVLSNIIASQIEVHKPYGGVYPMLAKREHIKNLPIILEKALKNAKILSPEKEVDLIAVTNGPGLEPCLWTGVNFAKELAEKWNVPLIPVNHIESHILVNFLSGPMDRSTGPWFPAVCLVVSGGHTQLILMKNPPASRGKYRILGETRDDAAGECFDKCAKILGLSYPGGPIIAKLAAETRSPLISGERVSAKLPRPMIYTKDYDFSFSGLKTAVLYSWQKIDDRQKTASMKAVFAKEIQQAINDVLIKKTLKAAKDFEAKTIILGGGVSANCELRSQFKSEIRNSKSEINLVFPPPKLSTDNAVMTAITAWFHKNKKLVKSDITKLKAEGNLRID